MENLAAEGAEEVVNDVEYTHSSSKFTIQGAYDGSRKVVPEPVGLLEYHSANHEPTREEYAQGHPLPPCRPTHIRHAVLFCSFFIF